VTGAGRISLCVTCKNRLWQLTQTLPANLDAATADGNTEIVLVNYNSADELDQWIRQYQAHINEGVLRYVHERSEPYFHASKAKNLAHLTATGKYLINLDGDNYIGDTIPTWRHVWAQCDNIIIHGECVEPSQEPESGNGTYGRIGLPRASFIALGGYDEEMLPSAWEDVDLIHRALAYGLFLARRSQPPPYSIRNTHIDTMKYSGMTLDWWQVWESNKQRSDNNVKLGRLVANRARKPVKVLLNFFEEIEV
jgi:predicted glycosyltransferase involved in capsule biosynthesis